jgi:type III secretory pathway component EscS
MQPKKLEQYKYFQPIAWTVCLTFAGFVGLLTIELKNTVNHLQESTLSFEARLQNVEGAIKVNPPVSNFKQ